MLSLRPSAALLVACLAASIPAQTILQTDNYGYSGSAAFENVARDPNGTLWALSITDMGSSKPLLLQASVDNGATWVPHSFVFNDASSGLNGPTFATNCTLAIDDQGTIHAIWGVYAYPSPYTQYYRQYNPGTGVASAIRNITSHVGATSSIRTTAMGIQIDPMNTVWIVCQGTGSWADALARSNMPYASDLNFTRIANISPSASAQSTTMAIDALGVLHFAFYRNTGAGEFHHRTYDPATSTWSAATPLGNTTPTNDLYGDICADTLGNVHCVYIMDADTANCSTPPKLRYRKWDPVNGWGSEVVITDIPTSSYCGKANGRIFAMACDENTGKVWVVFRDLAGTGSLELLELPLNGTAFTPILNLAPAAAGVHEYYSPTIRGTLFPTFNRTGSSLDITWQWRPPAGPPNSLFYQRVETGLPSATLSLSAPPVIGTSLTIDLSSPADPGAGFACGIAEGTAPGIPLPDGRTVPLNFDLLLSFTLTPGNGVLSNNIGALSPTGTASVNLDIPNYPPIIGVSVYAGFIVADPSNPIGIGTISPPLTITLQ